MVFSFLHTGMPGEIAYDGWLFPWTWLLASTLSLIIVGNLFIPIFYKMRLTSVYEVISVGIMPIKAYCMYVGLRSTVGLVERTG